MFQEALSALQKGDRPRARDLFARLMKTNKTDPRYWLWMSAAVETSNERLYCLQEALRLDPQNVQARQGLILFGALPPDPKLAIPVEFQKRDWQTLLIASKEPTPVQSTPIKRQWIYAGAALLGLLLIVVAVLIGTGKPSETVYVPRGVLATAGPTTTYLPSLTPVVRTATPTFIGPTPLWMLLESTYTPTPLYINTQHPIVESYRSAIRAYERGDWTMVITFMEQVADAEPAAADAYFYIGQAYRYQKNYTDAAKAYARSAEINATFAPAYWGQARVLIENNPGNKAQQANALTLLKKAVELDPNYYEAYIDLAAMALQAENAPAALDYLGKAAQLAPDSVEVFRYQAQAYLLDKNWPNALTAAREANKRDITHVGSYLYLAEALQGSGQLADSIQPLQTFLMHAPDAGADPHYMLAVGYHAGDQDDAALDQLAQVIALDRFYLNAYLLQGTIRMEQEKFQEALDAFTTASKVNTKSFEAVLGKGQALQALDNMGDAYTQYTGALALAKTDDQRALAYLYRAEVLAAIDQLTAAVNDLKNILKLDPAVVPAELIEKAQDQLQALATPTPTINPSAEPTGAQQTVTPTP